MAALAVTLAAVPRVRGDADATPSAAKQIEPKADSARKAEVASSTPEKFGVVINEARAFPGYNLIDPGGKMTYLYDNEGRVVHSWTSEYTGHSVAYLLDNGHLFRTAEATNRNKRFRGPAMGGRFQEFDWDGNILWDFEYHSDRRQPHHDAIKLPNGNALLICWEMVEEKEAVAAGRRPETVKDSHLQPDALVEIKPTGPKTGEIVWEWRSWEHLIQDQDRNKPNYGKVADHPERFDLNYIPGEDDPAPPARGPGKPAEKRVPVNPDWMHVNAVAYNADLDQIVFSSPHFSEIWIIDHGTTTEEARGHTGGRWGKGGDILYRWGNPRVYRSGTKVDQRLFGQHNIQWIPKGLHGEGHLLVFNNGARREPEEYSAVDELEPPTDKAGHYIRREHAPFGPDAPLWSYSNKADFFSWYISGTQRLPNGNTLVDAGAQGIVFEVTPEKEVVWKCINPFKDSPPPASSVPKPFAVIDKGSRDELGMKEEQRKKLDEIDQELNARLDEILNPEQKKILNEGNDIEFSKVPAGEYLVQFKREKLKTTEAQAQKLEALQKDYNPRIAMILTEDQKREIDDFKKSVAGTPTSRPRKTGNSLFRATRYALNHPAFEGRTLKPGKTLVELQEEREHPQPSPEPNLAGPKTAENAK
jgi:hypothetical protein